MATYAQISDLTTYGLPPTALQSPNLPVQVVQGALNDASDIADSYLRGRYALPLLAWGTELTQAVCRIAAYNLLSVRGYNPAAAADVNIRDRYTDALDWLNKVQRQAVHPNVTPQPSQTPQYNQPFVTSFSVISTATGQKAPQRGW